MKPESETGGAAKVAEYFASIRSGHMRLDELEGLFKKTVTERILSEPLPEDELTARILLANIVPKEHWGVIWNPDTLDREWTVGEADAENAGLKVHAKKIIQHILQSRVKIQLTPEAAVTVSEAREYASAENISSSQLGSDRLNTVGNFEKDGHKVLFDNREHGQDGFAKAGNVYAICDGLSSGPRSGAVSKLFAWGLATNAHEYGSLTRLLKEKPEFVDDLLDHIASSDEYQDMTEAEDKGQTTFTAVEVVGNTIEYAALGDSPLMVVDTDEAGNIVGYEIVTENNITSENYHTSENLETLQDPATYAVGIRNGKTETGHFEHVRYGTIEHKKGRSVVLASDFLTKLMVTSQKVASKKAERAFTEGKQELGIAWQNFAEKNAREFQELWLPSGTLNPLFFKDLSASRLNDLMERWKKERIMAADDITAIALNLDKLMAAQRIVASREL